MKRKPVSVVLHTMLISCLFVNVSHASVFLDCLQYDDGVPAWIPLQGVFRCTWFDTSDFYPESGGFLLEAAEIWLYVPSSEADSFTLSVHNGGSTAPGPALYDTTLAVQEMTGPVIEFPEIVLTESEFWLVMTIQSFSNQWPAIMCDDSPNPVSHSFYSDDSITWEPLVVQGPTANDYLLRACGTPQSSQGLVPDTWGSIKTLSRSLPEVD